VFAVDGCEILDRACERFGQIPIHCWVDLRPRDTQCSCAWGA
jgi:hypothetical protein